VKEKIKIPNAIFEVTTRCNLNCRYCYNIWKMPEAVPVSFNSYKIAKRTLKRLFKVTNVSQVTMTGGEPFMAERFSELVLYAKMKGKSVAIISNGTYAEMNDYRQLMELGVNTFELPLHSHTGREHDFMTRCNGSWNRVVASIDYISGHGGTVVGVIIISKVNYRSIGETIRFLHAIGINRIMLNRFNIGGEGIVEKDNLLIGNDMLRETFAEADSVAAAPGLKVTSNVCVPRCVVNPDNYKNIGFTHCSSEIMRKPVTIDAQGNLRVCNHSPVYFGNIFRDDLKKLFGSAYINEWADTIPEYCADCDDFSSCLGGCRAASEQLGLGLNEPDPIVKHLDL
jgi:radical SAM protein with 4Fe4S-binding SPASM domain